MPWGDTALRNVRAHQFLDWASESKELRGVVGVYVTDTEVVALVREDEHIVSGEFYGLKIRCRVVGPVECESV